VHEKIYDEFLNAFISHTRTLIVGDGFDENVFIGPVQNSVQYERVKSILEDVRQQDHVTAYTGELRDGLKGYFIPPTIVDNPPDHSRIVVEEPFGKLEIVIVTVCFPIINHYLRSNNSDFKMVVGKRCDSASKRFDIWPGSIHLDSKFEPRFSSCNKVRSRLCLD
jgi:hypothetical protein